MTSGIGAGGPGLNPGKLKRLYPRFCTSITFPEVDIENIPLRSEMWLVRMIEDVYDEAMSDCSKNNITNRTVRRSVLDLGSMDAFPFVAKRLLQRRYSVLECMQAMMLEFLVTLHHYMDKELKVLHSHMSPYAAVMNNMVNGRRTTVFAKFLSEEYDLSYVALYLHSRESAQTHLNIRFAHLVAPRIWMDIIEEDLENESRPFDTTGDQQADRHDENLRGEYVATNFKHMHTRATDNATKQLKLPKPPKPVSARYVEDESNAHLMAKGTPLKLPKFMVFSQDTSLSEVALASIDVLALPLLFADLFIGFATDTKVYFAEKLIETTAKYTYTTALQLNEYPVPVYFLVSQQQKQQQSTEEIFRTEEEVAAQQASLPSAPNGPISSSVRPSTNSKQYYSTVEEVITSNIYRDYVTHIPLSILFHTLIDEWKKIPASAKDRFMGREEATEQLRMLNVIYDKDSQMLKEIAESIRLAQVELSLCVSNLLKLEKNQRRLERKWNDDQASGKDLDELTVVRVAVAEGTAAK
jgi:hypothetical protein